MFWMMGTVALRLPAIIESFSVPSLAPFLGEPLAPIAVAGHTDQEIGLFAEIRLHRLLGQHGGKKIVRHQLDESLFD